MSTATKRPLGRPRLYNSACEKQKAFNARRRVPAADMDALRQAACVALGTELPDAPAEWVPALTARLKKPCQSCR